MEEGRVAAEVVVADAKTGLQEHTTVTQFWCGTGAGTYHSIKVPHYHSATVLV